MSSEIEFQIEEILEAGEETALCGRCIKGPIKVGNTFKLAFDQDVDEEGHVTLINEREIDLTVIKVLSPVPGLDEIDKGFTGRVYVLSKHSKESLLKEQISLRG